MTKQPDDGKVIGFDAARRRAGAREFATFAARLVREREQAEGVVARHLRDTPLEEWPRLAEVAELRNNAALEQMSDEVRKRIDRDSVCALALANVATSIAESLPPSSYPPPVLAQIRATAWRDRANALCYLGRYDEARTAVDRAASILERFPGSVHDRAIVQFVNAMILAQTGNYDEARACVEECRAVFNDLGDAPRALQAGMIEANALYEAARFPEALRLYHQLLQEAFAARDVESQARLCNNIAYCETQVGDFVAANIHFSDAVAKFTDLGYWSEIPRTQRGAGRILVARGQYATGIAHLREARNAFTAKGMVIEAGLCGLDIAAALVERGDDAAARSMVDVILHELTAARVEPCIIDSVARLRAALDVDNATAETVRTVHTELETLVRELPSC